MARIVVPEAVVKDSSPTVESFDWRRLKVIWNDSTWDAVNLSMDRSFVRTRTCFACGPWLGKLFPQTIGARVKATKQDMFFFGAPAGDDRFSEARLPVWGDRPGAVYVRYSGE